MADIKFVVSDPKTGKAYNVTVTGPKINKLVGKSIGSEVDGEAFGLPGYMLVITGGSDNIGVPMRRDIPGQSRRKVLVAGGTGYHPVSYGIRRRRLLRGREVSGDCVQVNAKVSAYGSKSLEELVPKEEKKEAKKEAARAPVKKK